MRTARRARGLPVEQSIRTEHVSDLGGLARLEPEWRELEESAQPHGPGVRWDYVHPWYLHFAAGWREPRAILARRDGVLVGAAPLVAWTGTLGRVPVRRLDFVGYPWDGGELLLRDGAAEAAGAIVESLAARGGFDVLCMNGLDPSGTTWTSVETAARRARLRLVRSDYALAIVALAAGFDRYCASMSPNFRHNLRRMTRRLEGAGGWDLDRLAFGRPHPDEIGRFLRRAFNIVGRSWKVRQGGPEAPEHRRFFEDTLRRFDARGHADIAILTVGGRDAAFIAALVEGDAYHDFTISFDDDFRDLSPGIFLMIEMFRRLAPEGIRVVVSAGAHEYKRRWASAFVSASRAYLFPPTLRAFLGRAARFTLPDRLSRLRKLAAPRLSGGSVGHGGVRR